MNAIAIKGEIIEMEEERKLRPIGSVHAAIAPKKKNDTEREEERKRKL